MALRPQYSLIHSEFNDFLFASVGEEKNGIELTVLSALTRLGVDPWGEAARLADLPREAAARALAAALSALPEGDWKVSDTWAIAARLVDRLPGRSAPATRSPRAESNKNEGRRAGPAVWVICVVLVATVLFATWYLAPDHGSEAVPSAVSSVRR
ncbi:MAG: hypothetical protein ACLQJR_18630 [Stellaceae bacterium]